MYKLEILMNLLIGVSYSIGIYLNEDGLQGYK
jgi:hypothetical protein